MMADGPDELPEATKKKKPPTREPNFVLMEEFAAWEATPRRLKTSLGLPTSKAQFAQFKGMSERTLYRWLKDPSFLKLLEQKKLIQLANTPNSSVSAQIGAPRPYTDKRAVRSRGLEPAKPAQDQDDPVYDVPGADQGEVAYLKVKDTLARMAADGNQGAMDLFLKHYGKSYLEAEREDVNPFEALSDVQLVHRVLETIGAEYVADWVANRVVADA